MRNICIWNHLLLQLAECYKNIDLAEYEKMKNEREQIKASYFFVYVAATFASIKLDDSFKVVINNINI